MFILQKNFFVYPQNDDVSNQKAVVIGSRIKERDKKNAEYYVGDYFLKVYFSISDFHLSNTGLETTVMFVGVFPKWVFGFFDRLCQRPHKSFI